MKKTRVLIIIFVVLGVGLIISGISISISMKKNEEKIIQEKEQMKIQRREMIEEINSHYGRVVVTNKEANLYKLDNDKYKEIGTIAKDEVISLGEVNIDDTTKYFYIENLDLYILYKDVEVVENQTVEDKDLRYKNYILFNENVISKDQVNLYRDDKIIYTLNYSIDEEIIRKEDNGYYIEYFGELLFINNDDVSKTYEKINSNVEVADEVPVTVYHFIYLEGDNTCNEAICHHENQIKEQFQYLKDNSYFTMNTTEMRLFLEGKIRVPKKSILITIDDGARAEKFVPLLEEYKVNATLFLISSWYPKEKFASIYMEIASHTHNLHTPGVCSGGQGSPLKCLDNSELVSDLKLSRSTLNNTEAFCFPFYEYNDHAIKAVQDAGFKISFIGGQVKARVGIDLFKVPRISIQRTTSLNQYINYVS